MAKTRTKSTYIVLLRGVMPTGRNRVPMARLREVLAAAGFGNVRTYIQSGNVVLESELPPEEVEKRVHDLIAEHIGPDLVVVVRTGSQLRKVLDENPFQVGHDRSRVFFVSFAEPPPADRVNDLLARDFGPEKVAIVGDAGYLYIPGSSARSSISNNNLEKLLRVSATTRNYNTISRLIELSEASGSARSGTRDAAPGDA